MHVPSLFELCSTFEASNVNHVVMLFYKARFYMSFEQGKNSKLSSGWSYTVCCITVDYKSVSALAYLQYSVYCCAIAENPPLVCFHWSGLIM